MDTLHWRVDAVCQQFIRTKGNARLFICEFVYLLFVFVYLCVFVFVSIIIYQFVFVFIFVFVFVYLYGELTLCMSAIYQQKGDARLCKVTKKNG